jgi:hypothetical protein
MLVPLLVVPIVSLLGPAPEPALVAAALGAAGSGEPATDRGAAAA